MRASSQDGYVLIKVGVDHHLADVRGYAYEHRLVMDEKIGRRLKPREIVHHIDGNKTNNSFNNLDVVASVAHHRYEHRVHDRGRRIPGEDNPEISCACGCGVALLKYDVYQRPRRFVSGHNRTVRRSL